ncbi:MAG: hypothetical protein HOE62_22465 [Alphaproteobacteria bacterium]|jgi:hypothetical protein|nr:hypothetical protein [Alphaproteobacteria bacterium]MBT4020731.1 hypothetical protein [Alphaproteobacteria bacterium]MBT4965179.1 hypothetical protein [Alphaproteobacteria bacterium]MBT5159664.1 hypothetical protein [Alphaproteobacteria bacterium]MBT6384558.1 hypothetical protein [Alphaproteobacteria bacterium]
MCPLDYDIDEDLGVVHLRGSGQVTNDDMQNMPTRVAADKRLRKGMLSLTDLSNITEYKVTTEGVERYMATLESTREVRGQSKAAIVAPMDLHYGMARVLELKSDGRGPLRYMVFRNREDACKWLGIDDPESVTK